MKKKTKAKYRSFNPVRRGWIHDSLGFVNVGVVAARLDNTGRVWFRINVEGHPWFASSAVRFESPWTIFGTHVGPK